MNAITKSIVKWLYHLFELAISGAVTALMAAPLFAAAEKIGLNVLALNMQDMGLIALSGMIGSILPYLKQSPLPKFKELDDTEIIARQVTEVKVEEKIIEKEKK